MIIFYNKISGKIYGTVGGRVHTEEELNTSVEPMGVNKEEIEKVILRENATKSIEKHLEKNMSHVLDYKIDVNNKSKLSFLPKDIIVEQSPNSTETIVIDLTQSLDKLLASFSETTRRWIKASDKLEFREYGFNEGRDLAMKVIQELEDKKDIHMGSQILRTRAPFYDGLRRLYIITEGSEALAVAVITPYLKRFIYTIGGVNVKGRELHAGDRLIWGLIQDAKYLGFTEFDFGGLFGEDQSEELKKVNIFKSRWGGERQPLVKK